MQKKVKIEYNGLLEKDETGSTTRLSEQGVNPAAEFNEDQLKVKRSVNIFTFSGYPIG